MDTNNIFLGTEIKLNIHIEPIGDMRMEDYDYTWGYPDKLRF